MIKSLSLEEQWVLQVRSGIFAKGCGQTLCMAWVTVSVPDIIFTVKKNSEFSNPLLLSGLDSTENISINEVRDAGFLLSDSQKHCTAPYAVLCTVLQNGWRMLKIWKQTYNVPLAPTEAAWEKLIVNS